MSDRGCGISDKTGLRRRAAEARGVSALSMRKSLMHSVKTSQPILENLETRQRPEVKE